MKEHFLCARADLGVSGIHQNSKPAQIVFDKCPFPHFGKGFRWQTDVDLKKTELQREVGAPEIYCLLASIPVSQRTW